MPKNLVILKEIKLYQEIDTQKYGNSPERYPKIQDQPRKSTQNNGTSPYHDICKLIP